MYGEATLPKPTHQEIPSVDHIEEYRPTDATERGIKQRDGGVLVGSDDRSDLGSDPTRPRQHEAAVVVTHQGKLWQSTQ